MSRTSEGASENASKLIELAKGRFGELNEAEEKLFRSFADGEIADYSTEKEKDNDPAKSDKWGRERILDADRIAWLCTDPEASAMVTHKGIWVRGARIDGGLNLTYARISFPLDFEKSAFAGVIYLRHAEIQHLVFEGTYTGTIYGDGLKVEGHVLLRKGFKAEGEVRLVGATIGGDLSCTGGKFINKGAKALSADGANIEGNVHLIGGFKAEGEVNLVGATIGGQLDCVKGQFINKGATALNADSANIEGSVFLRYGFKAEGEVNLVSATIGGTLECHNGHFINPNGMALNANDLYVKQNALFIDVIFEANGEVSLVNAGIKGFFYWMDLTSTENVRLDLRSAKIGTLRDEEKSWPEKGKLLLHGLVYDEIHNTAPRDAERRIDWLRRQPGFWPQPYEQLAAVLRKGGQDEDARKILIAKNKDKARHTKLTFTEKCWYRVLGPMIGYGYRPWRALWIGIVIVLVGWLLFWAGYSADVMTPTKEGAYVSGSSSEKSHISPDYSKFCAPFYSMDVFVPLVDLHQSNYWLPNANRDGELQLGKFSIPVCGKILRYYLWFEIIAGWILTSLLVVGLTGLVCT